MKTFYLAPSREAIGEGRSGSADPNAFQMHETLEGAQQAIPRSAHSRIMEIQFDDRFVEMMVSKMLTFTEGDSEGEGQSTSRPYLGTIAGGLFNLNQVCGLFYLDDEDGAIEVLFQNGETRVLPAEFESVEEFHECAKQLVMRM